MQQSTERYFIVGAIRETILTLTPKQVLTQQEIHGANLRRIRGDGESQPAAAGITKITLRQGELPKVKKEKSTREGKYLKKPVVNITKGTYFPSVDEAARSVDTVSRHLCVHLTQSSKVKRKSVKGDVFRYATPIEIEVGRAMVTEWERAGLPKMHYNTGRKPNPTATSQPIVCLTTGDYYPSVYSAAEALGLPKSNLSDHLRPNSKKVRKHVKGYAFRYATPEEIATH